MSDKSEIINNPLNVIDEMTNNKIVELTNENQQLKIDNAKVNLENIELKRDLNQYKSLEDFNVLQLSKHEKPLSNISELEILKNFNRERLNEKLKGEKKYGK